MTGTGLGAILFGPFAVSILGLIVLIFQSILLAHGGLTTLGANTFSMAIAGPFLTFGIYILCKKLKVNNKINIFLATSLGCLFTYCVTAGQLALAYPSADGGVGASLVKFMGIFAITQIPLAVIEGLLSILIMSIIEVYANNELADLNYKVEKKVSNSAKRTIIACSLAVLLLVFVPLLALRGAEFEGSDGQGSEMVEEIQGEHGEEYEPWFEPILEVFLGGEIPGEMETLLFCLQTGIGVSIIAFSIGRLIERRKSRKDDDDDLEISKA